MRLLVGGEPVPEQSESSATAGRTVSPAAQSPYGTDEPASPPTNSPACQYLTDATDVLIEELDALITRNFARARTIGAVQCADGRWIAVTGEGRQLFPPASKPVVERFVLAFARHHDEFSVRV